MLSEIIKTEIFAKSINWLKLFFGKINNNNNINL